MREGWSEEVGGGRGGSEAGEERGFEDQEKRARYFLLAATVERGTAGECEIDLGGVTPSQVMQGSRGGEVWAGLGAGAFLQGGSVVDGGGWMPALLETES